ncbi:unnamed protein product [Lupinus luteus]|uniref:NADH dehydrogenase [ubiquinone] 1 beta subcomplex subunit 9 n=1 Tax=Lupinus luteus TaxID=3873 RepID=A0AAV1XBT6_LUPLU
MTSSVAYFARRAAQKERVRILYRRALKDTLNWAVHRHLFYEDASNLRGRFNQNKHVVSSIPYFLFSGLVTAHLFNNLQEDVDTIDRIIADAEASYNKWRHPDPYIDSDTL